MFYPPSFFALVNQRRNRFSRSSSRVNVPRLSLCENDWGSEDAFNVNA